MPQKGAHDSTEIQGDDMPETHGNGYELRNDVIKDIISDEQTYETPDTFSCRPRIEHGSEVRDTEKQYTAEFCNAVMKCDQVFSEDEANEYAQIAINGDMNICYINEIAQKLLNGAKCGKCLSEYAKIEGIERISKEKLPVQAVLYCANGAFMCVVSKMPVEREDCYCIYIAYSEKHSEKGLYSFLAAKLAILNLQKLSLKRNNGRFRTDRQTEYISGKFDAQAKKALKIQTLMLSPAVLTSKSEFSCASEYLNNIARRYCTAVRFKARCGNRNVSDSFSIECEDDHYIGINPVFAMATVYLTDAVYSVSKTGHVVLGAERDTEDELTDVITFKTAVGRKLYNSVASLSEGLTDPDESEFYKMFFINIISKYAKPPKLSVKGGELTVRLYLPRRTAEYILRDYTSALRRFSYLDAMFAMLELESDTDYDFFPER